MDPSRRALLERTVEDFFLSLSSALLRIKIVAAPASTLAKASASWLCAEVGVASDATIAKLPIVAVKRLIFGTLYLFTRIAGLRFRRRGFDLGLRRQDKQYRRTDIG